MTDAELLQSARRGDARAVAELLARHQPRIYRFAMKMCGHPEDAEDVLQETMLSAARSLEGFRGQSSLSTWLYTIARSHCIKKRRTRKDAPTREDSVDHDTQQHPGRAPDELAADHELTRALELAITRLPPDQREVLLLRDVEGLKASEVAEVLAISTAAVKSRLHRARLAVREGLAPSLGVGPAGPSCPDVLTAYSRHAEGELSAELCREMERHLDSCAACRGACDSLKQSLALCSQLPAARVPESVQASVQRALATVLREGSPGR